MTRVHPRTHASPEKHDYPTYKIGNSGQILSDTDRHAVQWHKTRPFSQKPILCRSIPSNNVIMSSNAITDIIMFIQWCSNIRVCVSHINITQGWDNVTQGWLSHIQNWSEVQLYAHSTQRSSTIYNPHLVWDPGPSIALASMLAWKPHDPSTAYLVCWKRLGPDWHLLHAMYNSI